MRSLSRLHSRSAMLLAVVAAGSAAWAHVRLKNPGNGFELRWGAPTSISIVINATGSADVTDGSHVAALQNAIRAWNDAPGSSARLVENASAGQRARTDWQSDDLHLLYFDETGSSGYFPAGSGIVAITPVWFTNSGVISDADVLFNGRDFDFTTSGASARFDIQDVATHELGHLLGLDHSGWAGATMYPYVDPSVVLHRSLAQDDVCGVRDAYPSTAFGTISGVIRRANDSFVAGAHVVARGSNGRPYGADVCTGLGAFKIHGLPQGTYTLFATPLDAPVSAANLGPGHPVHTDFQSTMIGTFALDQGDIDEGELSIGSRTVLGDTPLGLGRTADTYPLRCIMGGTRTLYARGSGLVDGCTLEASDPTLVIEVISWNSSLVAFRATAPADAAPGHSDLTVTNASGDRHTLVAGLEITPPDPGVTSVTPTEGDFHGGTALTITGQQFRAGARVVIGARTYLDGAADGCTVESPTTIRLTTLAAPVGIHSITVVDATGVEGRKTNAFTFRAQPSIDSVFPLAGSAAGGTPLVLQGTDFVSGCTVTINGIVQVGVTLVSSTKIAVTTGPGVPGGPYVIEVTNPLGESASALYSYTLAPDPLIDALEPASGSEDGGDVVMVRGANFTPATMVVFGVNSDSGAGGVHAEVEFVDSENLRVVTPAFNDGRRNVIVLDALTSQAALSPAAFTFTAEGGGGGGCAGTIAPKGPPFRGMSSWIGVACAFAWLVFQARKSKRAVA